jgi:DNA replication protein DnaC
MEKQSTPVIEDEWERASRIDIAQRENGTATCEKHGEYQVRVFGSGDFSFKPGCPSCEQESYARQEKEEADQKAHARASRINHNLRELNIGERFKNMSFADYETPAPEILRVKTICEKYVTTFPDRLKTGDGLILVGGCGTGKNMLAACICKGIVGQDYTALHTTVFKLIRKVKGAWRKDSNETENQVINSFTEPDLLVIDEVGVQFGSETERLYLTEIINERYERMRPTILISNLTPDKLEEVVGERVIDRFHEGKGAVLTFTWDSYRRKREKQ